MKLISESELRELLIASERLARLDAFAVNEWEGYDYAMKGSHHYPDFGKSFNDWMEVDLNDLLKEYDDYEVNF